MEEKDDNSRKHQGTQPFLHKQPARHGNGDKGRVPQQAGPAGPELPQDAIMVKGTDEEGREEILFYGTIQEAHIFYENGVS